MTKNPFTNRIINYGTKPADQFQANPLNHRLHPQKQRDAVQASLRELGWIGVCVENRRTGQLIDGHERVWQALANNEDVPYIEVDLSPDEEKLALAIFDPITYMAETDAEILDALLREVNTGEAALQELLAEMAEENGLYGDEAGAVQDVAPQVDRAEELRVKWGVQSGDLWQLGEHRLICGDCTDAEVVARVMDGDRFDLVVTSPPYNSGDGGYKTDYSGKTKRFYQEDTDDRTEAEWVEFCERVLSLCGQHARDDRSVIAWNVMYTARCRSGYGQVLFGGRQPFTVKETICWDKGQGFPTASKGILSRNWELIFILSKGEKYNTTQGENEPRWAKWDIARPKAQEETHKATYPVELPMKVMTDFGGDIIYEPFSGSGTTIIACEQLGRKCRAVEISPAYVAVALERWAGATKREPVRVG